MADRTQELAQAARDLITSESEAVAGFHLFEIIAMHDLAAKEVSRRVAESTDLARRNLLRAISATGANVVAGAADLTSNFSTDRIFPQYMNQAEIRLISAATDPPFQWSATRALLSLKLPTDTIYRRFAVEGQTLYVRDVDGSLTNSLGSIQIVANFYYLVNNSISLLQIPEALADEHKRALAQIATAHIPARVGRSQTGASPQARDMRRP